MRGQHQIPCLAFTCHSECGCTADTAILIRGFAGILAAVNNLGSQNFQAGDIIWRSNRTLVTLINFSASFKPLESDIRGTLDLTGELGEVAQSYFKGLDSPLDHGSSCKGKQSLLAGLLIKQTTFFFSF